MNRGRRRKPRLTRMDAALDAMALLGFPEEKVKKRVKQLLKVYGSQGWPFIEDSAYKELIEDLLRDGEENDHEKGTENCCNSKDKCIEDETAAPEASSRVSDRQQDEIPEDTTPVDTAEYSPDVAEPPKPKPVSSSPCRSFVDDAAPVEGGSKVWKDILLHHSSGDLEETASAGDGSGNKAISPIKNPIPASSLPLSNISRALPAGSSLLPRWHLPCYGWIQRDKEEDLGDFKNLTPAPGEFGAMLTSPPGLHATSPSFATNSNRKRRTRWDVKPEDPYST